jgi:ribosome-associated protein
MKKAYDRLVSECSFTTTRSSGSGGQHVNKVESRVTLLFDILNSQMLSEEQKKLLGEKLKNRISKEGILQLSSEAERSQSMNKKAVINRFRSLIEGALQPVKKRKPTKPTAASIRKRLERKKQLSEKKRIRGGKIDN